MSSDPVPEMPGSNELRSTRHESMAIGGLCHAAANLLGPEDVFINTMHLGVCMAAGNQMGWLVHFFSVHGPYLINWVPINLGYLGLGK